MWRCLQQCGSGCETGRCARKRNRAANDREIQRNHAEMRAGQSRDSTNCADFAEGLAFTGCRVGEAREITLRIYLQMGTDP